MRHFRRAGNFQFDLRPVEEVAAVEHIGQWVHGCQMMEHCLGVFEMVQGAGFRPLIEKDRRANDQGDRDQIDQPVDARGVAST